MAIVYTWTVESVDSTPASSPTDNLVIRVRWKCSGTEDKTTQFIIGVCNLAVGEGPYTPYNDLTQSEMLGWIWADGVNKDNVEGDIATMVAYEQEPTEVDTPLPW